MRYSIIHHDVREKFGLTISQYLVADSIHQLSHGGPMKRTDTEISAFLGLDRSHVGHTRKELIKKGLVEETAEGQRTTEMWSAAVTYKRGKSPRGENPTQNGENPHSHNIYKEIKNSAAKAATLPHRIVSDAPKVRAVKDNGAMRLRSKLYEMFEDEYGTSCTPTQGDYMRVLAALKVLDEKEVVDLVEEALEGAKPPHTVRQALTDRAIDVYRHEHA